MTETPLDERNAEFWNVLSGWAMARSAGLTGDTVEDLRRFDEVYLGYYPYLRGYVDSEPLEGKRVLEIGLGFGTLGQLLASRGGEYHALDIAREPVELMRRRLSALGLPPERAQQGSVLELPHADDSFDYVYSIGCLHHTGNLQRAIDEIYRVLTSQGRAIVMVYYSGSLRQRVQSLRAFLSRRGSSGEELRAMYDVDETGAAAPHTDFVSRSEAKELFAKFAAVRLDVRNFDDYGIGPFSVSRKLFLWNIARVVGLDLYIIADAAR